MKPKKENSCYSYADLTIGWMHEKLQASLEQSPNAFLPPYQNQCQENGETDLDLEMPWEKGRVAFRVN